MFVPAHNSHMIESSLKSEADILLFDLEDSVQPLSNKANARENIIRFLNAGLTSGRVICPRINDIESGLILDDLNELTISGVWGFMCPKTQDKKDIHFVDRLLTALERKKGFDHGHFKLVPLIETSSAVLRADEICKASERVRAIAFGCEDYITDLGGVHDREGLSIFTARSLIAIAAKANKISPIDTVHIAVHDLDHLEENLILAKKLGFEGMLVLHPKEIPLVHKYFSPSDGDVADAERLIKLAQTSYADGRGVSLVGGTFVGPPMVAAAEKVLAKHRLIRKK
mgnify:CR=1 FL=1